MNTIKSKSSVKILVTILFVSFIASCNSESINNGVALEKVEISETFNGVSPTSTIFNAKSTVTDSIKKLKIIKSANVRFKVKNVKIATKKIGLIVHRLEGYISDQRLQNTNYKVENRFTIKVPEPQFDRLLDSLMQVAEFVEFQNITSDDVTEEYIDLQSRLKTKLEIKKRYEAVLRKRANTVKDILVAEDMIGNIQEEIEATQGRLKYLTNKVSFSTIQVDLYETVNYKEEPIDYTRTFFSKTKEGLSFGWNIIESILLGIIYIWPLIIIGGFLLVIFRKRIKK